MGALFPADRQRSSKGSTAPLCSIALAGGRCQLARAGLLLTANHAQGPARLAYSAGDRRKYD
jgi:hypothetical protein